MQQEKESDEEREKEEGTEEKERIRCEGKEGG
jgi:hypothetical protein